MTSPKIALAALLASASTALAADPRPALTLQSRFAALAGGASGLRTRTDSGGLGVFEASLVPTLRGGALALRVPVRLERDQAFGTDLTETLLAGELAPEWQVGKGVRLAAEAGALRVWRLDWPDQYQPNADLTLRKTDRYSYTALHAGANGYVRPARHHHLRARWRVTSYDYERDPAFTEADPTPTHLTPRDNVRNDLDLSWRYLADGWALAGRLDTSFRRDSVYPARRAMTGEPVPFARQRLNDYEPAVEVELRPLAKRVKLSLELGWAIRDDVFEGYYSYAGPHPRVAAEWAATDRLSVAASGQLWWLRYGPGSKTDTEDRARLYDHRGEVKAEIGYAVGGGVSVLGRASWRGRTTNYRDYEPNVLPAGRLYDIQWDYDNYRAVLGAEWRR